MKARPEQALQHATGQLLDLVLPKDALWLHYPAGGYRRPVEAKIFRSIGVKPGIPDLLVLHRGRCFGIELKVGRRGLTPVQRRMHQRLEQCGVPCAVASSPEQVEQFLRDLDIPLRGSVEARRP